MAKSPVVILYDAAGVAMAVQDGVAIPANTKGLLLAGKEGSNSRFVRVASDGTVRTDPTGTTTQPISGTVVANAGTGPFPVSDNGGSLTIDGTVTAHAGTGPWPVTDNGGSLTVDGPLTDSQLRATPVPISMSVGSYGGQVEGRASDGAAPVGNPVLVGGQDGTNTRAIRTDSQGRLVVVSPSGTLHGFCDGQAVLATTAVSAVLSTTYTQQTSNAQRSIVSASANDTSAGTGARTVKLTYYSVSGSTITGPFTETISLNGTTPVNTVSTTIAFIEKMEVLTVGSGLVNAGIISLKAATGGGGATVWSIAASANKTFGAHHYVPSGKTCNISGLLVGIKGADTTSGFLRSANPTDSSSAEVQISDNIRAPSSGQSFRSYSAPIQVSGPARIVGYVAPVSTSSRTYYLSFDFYEE